MQDTPFIGPVPTIDLAAIAAENIPHADVLLRYMEEETTTAAAFVRWAEERLDEADRRERLDHYDVDLLDAASVRIKDGLKRGESRFCDLQATLRDDVRLFCAAGLTFRQTASFCDVTVEQIVMLQMSPNARAQAEKIADLEEAILDGALERESARKLCMRLGLGLAFRLVPKLLALHAAAVVHQEAG